MVGSFDSASSERRPGEWVPSPKLRKKSPPLYVATRFDPRLATDEPSTLDSQMGPMLEGFNLPAGRPTKNLNPLLLLRTGWMSKIVVNTFNPLQRAHSPAVEFLRFLHKLRTANSIIYAR